MWNGLKCSRKFNYHALKVGFVFSSQNMGKKSDIKTAPKIYMLTGKMWRLLFRLIIIIIIIITVITIIISINN